MVSFLPTPSEATRGISGGGTRCGVCSFHLTKPPPRVKEEVRKAADWTNIHIPWTKAF